MIQRPRFILTFLCLFWYTVTQYGGIRAPDAEVVFRVAENLTAGKGFGVSSDLENWKGFGVAFGKDSVLYAVYPPGESLVLVPFILAARWANKTHWYENLSIPLSHYVNDGFRKMYYQKAEPQIEPHALRFLCTLMNILAGTLGALIFYSILLVMTRSQMASLFVSLLYAFGTMIWSYTATFFSEALTVAYILSSFYFLVSSDSAFSENKNPVTPMRFFFSGMALGLALVTHTNSALVAPFFTFYAWRICSKNRKLILFWVAGYVVFAVLLGWFNWLRFGNVFETGRGLSVNNPVDWVSLTSVKYWRNAYGILAGYGKGLILFCPAVIFGFLTWNTFHRKYRFLSRWFSLLIVFVIMFVASYEYWHAGFSLGPRYLIMTIPFMLIPSAFWVKEKIENKRGRTEFALFCGVLGLAVIQQLFFCVGELFSFYHIMKWSYLNKGVDIFLNDRIYLDWKLSPLHQLLSFKRGPFILQSIPLSNGILWLAMSVLALTLLFLIVNFFYRSTPLPKKTSRK